MTSLRTGFIFLIYMIMKISKTGKKKLERQVNKWCKDIISFMEEYGFCKKDNYYEEIKTIVWNYSDENSIVSWATSDEDTIGFIDEQIYKLANIVEKL